MITRAASRRIAIIGNPNTGKTCLFNALTGLSQRVGNYPGVTVEKKAGRLAPGIDVIDLPGTYSLAARSPDEMVAVRVLLGREPGESRPDAVIVIVDASNLKRNLYLVTQVLELGLPAIVALNMIDQAESVGVHVDVDALAERLGVPVMPTVASRGVGVAELRSRIEEMLENPVAPPAWEWPGALRAEIDRLTKGAGISSDRFLVGRALVDDGGEAERTLLGAGNGNGTGAAALREARRRVRESAGPPVALEARARYRWIESVLAQAVTSAPRPATVSDRIDAVVTHRVAGSVIFAAVMGAIFVSVFQWAVPLMDLTSAAFDRLAGIVSGLFAGTPLAGGALESLLVDGVIAGVGSVIVFLPQIAILFFFLALLEDCGYMARTAYLMDRLFRFCGLSGHSFLPLLSSFACAVPGVMAARTIANPRDRLATILVAPLMSCSARIPVYAILIAAFVPAATILGFLPVQGLVFVSMYVLGIAVAVIAALVLKKSLLRGPTPPFVMELPPYKTPSLRNVFIRVVERSRAFLQSAGTIILAMSIIVWALGYFPRPEKVTREFEARRARAAEEVSGPSLAQRLDDIGREEAAALLESSALGWMGRQIEPLVEPLGWDWRIGMAALASFPAREVVVSTLGIIYGLGDDAGEGDERDALMGKLHAARWPDGRKVFTLPVALSIMVFFALCLQCGSTIATIRREANSWRWAGFAFAYLSALAYVGALATYQIGSALL